MRHYGNYEFDITIIPSLGHGQKYTAKLQRLRNRLTREWIMNEGDHSPVADGVGETKELAEMRLTQKIYQWVNDHR